MMWVLTATHFASTPHNAIGMETDGKYDRRGEASLFAVGWRLAEQRGFSGRDALVHPLSVCALLGVPIVQGAPLVSP